ncbi:MAG: SGNH/GDSL hydrolase family protein, partial [Acidimicrobiales bacterium]
LGCSGETTTTFIQGGDCPYVAGSQLAAAEAFLSSHVGQVALVTIDIGGDDITGCASTKPPFPISSSCVAAAIATVSANLNTIGAGLRSAAGPSVPIIGMTYFDPFVVEWLSGSSGHTAAETSVNDLGQLNAALSSTYSSFGARVADVAGAFSTTDFTDLVSSPYGTIPKNVALACSWLLVVCSTTSSVIVGVHPNAIGYGVVAGAFEAALPASELASVVPPPASPSILPVPTLALTGFPAVAFGMLGVIAIALGTALVTISRRQRGPGVHRGGIANQD